MNNKLKSFLKIGSISLLTLIIGVFGYMKMTGKNINDMGLSVLSLVKDLKGERVDLDTLENTTKDVPTHEKLNEILQLYVDDRGVVNYKDWSKDTKGLDDYLSVLSNQPPTDNWTTSEALAYWINAYNAFTVKLILDYYPLKSIKNISDGLPMINSPWDLKFFKIGGVDFDLNTIEHEILRKQFNEPRIHFAINCASISCPNLLNKAYTAEQVEEQLEMQAIAFLNDTSKNRITKESAQLSSIFNWFQSDFTKSSTLLEYIQPFIETDLSSKAKVSYLEYDWNLNGI